MIVVAGLILLLVSLYAALNKLLYAGFEKERRSHAQLLGECGESSVENSRIANESLALDKKLKETVILYEMTRKICESLDEEKIFSNFLEQINKNIRLEDCRFLKGEVDLSPFKDYTVLSLQISKNTIGYLAASGIAPEDKEKFDILSHQFLLGVKRAVLYKRLQELAITDSLTGVFTRKHFLDRFTEEIEYSGKFGYRFAFLMLDVDHFKEYNDRYGHLVGDAVLRSVAKSIKDDLRQIDLIGRYGGEEFAVILTQTDKQGAVFAAERIRQSLAEKTIKSYDESLRVTISIGVAMFPDDAKDPQPLIEKADEALYKAKEAGRNKVCI